MDKTINVEVTRVAKHPRLPTYIRIRKKFMTHDEGQQCNEGDVVEIRQCRPRSKYKHFELNRIIKKREILTMDD